MTPHAAREYFRRLASMQIKRANEAREALLTETDPEIRKGLLRLIADHEAQAAIYRQRERDVK
jgi:hypothetical protein